MSAPRAPVTDRLPVAADHRPIAVQRSVPEPRAVSPTTFTLVAVGDLMLARSPSHLIRKYGPAYPFAAVASTLTQADLAFGNLESPISTRGQRNPAKLASSARGHTEHFFRADPLAAQALAKGGFDVVSLANNHAMDYGAAALQETLSLVQAQQIKTVGAGSNLPQARAVQMVTVNRVKVAFLAYVAFRNLRGGEAHLSAANSRTGTALLPGTCTDHPGGRTLAMMRNDLARARKEAEVIVVSFHWGNEGAATPTAYQRNLAHAAVDHGADLVLGHHPHVLQGLEWHNNALIAYSLGNFVFDYAGGVFGQTVIFHTTWQGNRLVAAKAIPVLIRNTRPTYQTGSAGVQLLQRLQSLCQRLGTSCTLDQEAARLLLSPR